MSPRLKLVWFAWLVFVLVITARPLLWHLEQFRNPGIHFYWVSLIAFPLVLLGSWAYSRARRRWLRWEPFAFLAVPYVLFGVYEPRVLLAAVILPLAMYALGVLSLRLARIDIAGGSLALVLPVVIGAGLMMTLLLPLALAGGLRFWPVLLAPVLLVFRQRRHLFSAVRVSMHAWRVDPSLTGVLAGICIPWLLIFEVLSVLTIIAPSRVWDVLRNHLFSAQYYSAASSLTPLPKLDYSFFPQGVELLMTTGLQLAGQTGAQLIPALFFPLLLGLGWLTARECGASRGAALIGITSAASIPSLHWTCSVAKNDAATAVFLLAGVYCYVRFVSTRNSRILLIGAFLTSAAFHVKHVAILGAVPICLLYLHAVWIGPRRIRTLASIAFITALVAPAYQIRAGIIKGKPFFPYSAGKIVSGNIEAYSTSRRSPARLITIPATLHFQGKPAWEWTSTSENPVGIVLFVFAPLAFLVRASSRRWLAIAFFAVVYYVFWGLMLVVVRYFIVVLAVLCFILADRIAILWQTQSRALRATLTAALLYSFLFGVMGTLLVEVNAPFVAYFLKQIDRDEYLGAVVDDYRSLSYAVRNAAPHDRIFGVDNCAAAYAGSPDRFDCKPCGAAARYCSLETIEDSLRQARFVIVSNAPALRHIGRYMEQERRAAPVFRDSHHTVFRAW